VRLEWIANREQFSSERRLSGLLWVQEHNLSLFSLKKCGPFMNIFGKSGARFENAVLL